MNNLHEAMYQRYVSWREQRGDLYVSLKSDKKILAEIINLLSQAIAAKKGERATSEEVMQGWAGLLSAWHRLPAFYGRRRELKNICSDFNTIINLLKNGKAHSQSDARHGATADAIARFRKGDS